MKLRYEKPGTGLRSDIKAILRYCLIWNCYRRCIQTFLRQEMIWLYRSLKILWIEQTMVWMVEKMKSCKVSSWTLFNSLLTRCETSLLQWSSKKFMLSFQSFSIKRFYSFVCIELHEKFFNRERPWFEWDFLYSNHEIRWVYISIKDDREKPQ